MKKKTNFSIYTQKFVIYFKIKIEAKVIFKKKIGFLENLQFTILIANVIFNYLFCILRL